MTEPVVPPTEKAYQNTDRELWRERPGDYYADSLFVTEGGGIGMNVGGFVVVMPIREWHKLAALPAPEPPPYKGPVSENEATRALAIALAEGFREQGINTTDAAAALIAQRDELVDEVASLKRTIEVLHSELGGVGRTGGSA